MNRKQKKVLRRIIITGIILILLMISERVVPVEIPAVLLFCIYMIPYIIIGYDILKKAVKGIFRGQVFDENFLMAIATVGAVILAKYSEAVSVMLFYQIGEFFQSYAVGKSRKNISELMNIRPDCAVLETDGIRKTVDPDEVTVGSIIVVSPGEKIPLDGVIVEGESFLDTAPLTGESVPRQVTPGSDVVSGCINLEGVIRIRTSKEFGESTVSKILDLVENASSRKSKSENFISKFARIYTPVVCIGALLLAILPPICGIVGGGEALWSKWIYRALTFLVISCPCALVISIPLTFFAGIGGAGKNGILIKGSNYLEMLSKAKYVAFDKTGTVTKGTFEITSMYIDESCTKDDLIEYAAYAEYYSNHPIGRCIKNAYGQTIDVKRLKNVNETAGQGISAELDEKRILVGNGKLLQNENIKIKECDEPGTTVYVAADGKFLGYILISDTVKDTAEEAINNLYKLGIEDTIMLTGDSRLIGSSVAEKLGIGQVFCELLPADKVGIVDKMIASKKRGKAFVFVGDGINDAPVLARADIGIAMGAIGSDAAIEAADVVIMDDDPAKIATSIAIASKCIAIVYENIYFAIGIKAVCLILGAFGIANMWLAIFADVGVMVLAVLNSLRALYSRK